MKSNPGLLNQYSAAKIQTISTMPTTNSKNFSNKLAASNKNFPRPIQMKKKQTSTVFNRNSNQLRSRLSKSIEQLPQTEASGSVMSLFDSPKSIMSKKFTKTNMNQILIQNCQEQRQDQLFSSSYQKLNNVYHNFGQYKNKSSIEQELSQVLVLIKEERATIRNKLQQIQVKRMKKSSLITTQTAQNTQQLIVKNDEKKTREIQIQTQNPQVQNHQQVINNQTYSKLIKILQDMNINSKQILPQDIKVEEQKQDSKEKKYQQLKQSEIIRVQKFVIKKLVQRISTLQNNNQESFA